MGKIVQEKYRPLHLLDFIELGFFALFISLKLKRIHIRMNRI